MSKTAQNDANCTGGGSGGTSTQTGTRTASLSAPSQGPAGTSSGGVIDRKRLQELVKEVDPLEQMDEDVEEVGRPYLI